MATAKYFKGGVLDGMLISSTQQTDAAATEGSLFTISNVFDASKEYSATAGGAAVLSGGGLTAADVGEIISVPAGTHVLAVYTTVITAEGATQVAEIGDGVDPNGYFTAADLNAAAGTAAINTGTHSGAAAGVGGVFYASADTIDLVPTTNNYNAGKVRITALCFAPVV